jgi:hypothetical protein
MKKRPLHGLVLLIGLLLCASTLPAAAENT